MPNSLLALGSHGRIWFGVLVDEDDRLLAAAFSESQKLVKRHLTSFSQKAETKAPREGSHRLAEEMSRLYDGKMLRTPIRLNESRVSDFQMKVYRLLNKIPRGRVTSYGLIAKAIDSGPRAVGNAVGSNPWPLFIPCHRVIPADRSVGNYSMTGKNRHPDSPVKRALLEREKVPFREAHVLPTALWNPE